MATAEYSKTFSAQRATEQRLRRLGEAEIGLPPLTDDQLYQGEKLWGLVKDDLYAFNRLVFPNSTGLRPFGPAQIDSIDHDQSIIESGGKLIKAESRGYGKTTRGCNAALWAVMSGRKRMPVIFSANLEKSQSQIMGRWRQEILFNRLLLMMRPNLIWPLVALDNKSQRAAGQTFKTELTRTTWRADRIGFPYVHQEIGAGSLLLALPLATCRGATHATPSGEILRPDLIIFDDVQRDQDALNPTTVAKLEELINTSALMLGGHSVSTSAIMNCTIRAEGDLGEQYMANPNWRRVRYKMLETRATHEKKHWLGRYAEIRTRFDPESPDDQRRAHREALQYYLDNRAEMDEGAKPTWEWAYQWGDPEPLEVSATQHAYNILIDNGELVFSCECQNEPYREQTGLQLLEARQVMAKQSALAAGIVPARAELITAYIDVHPELLYWESWAWLEDFQGYLVDRNTWPEQPNGPWPHERPPRPLSALYPGMVDSARIQAGLDALIPQLLTRQFETELHQQMGITRVLVDCNGAEATAIKEACRRSPHAANITPSMGKGVKAIHAPMYLWPTHSKKSGPNWVWQKKIVPGELKTLNIDTNYWKTKFHQGLAVPRGNPGSLVLFEAPPEIHRRAANHYLSEKPVEVTANGRTVIEWALRPNLENHYFDCAVGNLVAASLSGIAKPDAVKTKTARKTLGELRG